MILAESKAGEVRCPVLRTRCGGRRCAWWRWIAQPGPGGPFGFCGAAGRPVMHLDHRGLYPEDPGPAAGQPAGVQQATAGGLDDDF